jgi:DNA-binding GntR family transcriptional regulator
MEKSGGAILFLEIVTPGNHTINNGQGATQMPKKHPPAAKLTIYHQIRTEIITGKKMAGERLSIDRLKEQFGTSVTPVRDALQMLSQEGLVTIKPRSGYYVTIVTLKELNDMLDMRSILELAAVERAAQRISDEQIVRLETVHSGYTNDSDESYARYTTENKKFHCMVAQASGNHELATQVSHIHDRLARFTVMIQTGKVMARVHADLTERLKARDVPGAKAAMEEELSTAKTMIMDRIMEKEAVHWHLGTASSGS